MILFLNLIQIISILIIVCLVLACLVSAVENRRLTVTEYRICSEKLPPVFDGFRIVQLTDLHNAAFGEHNRRLLCRVEAAKPDVILITGDMFVCRSDGDVEIAAQTVNALAQIAPVYYSLGNHELRTVLYPEQYGDMWKHFRKRITADVSFLQDQKTKLVKENACICLYGLNLTPELYRRFQKTPMPPGYLESLFGICDPGLYHIFMAHNPDYFEDYAAWGADLTFSGHIHGGMVRLPFLGGVISPMVHFFPKYDRGLFEHAGRYMILSGGLGNHSIKFRINNLPEIVSVTLCQK